MPLWGPPCFHNHSLFFCFSVVSHRYGASVFACKLIFYLPIISQFFCSTDRSENCCCYPVLWEMCFSSGYIAGGQREELCPGQRSGGRRLGLLKDVIKPQETPCSRASNPKTRVCFMLSPTPLTLWGALPHNRFCQRRSKRAAPRQ